MGTYTRETLLPVARATVSSKHLCRIGRQGNASEAKLDAALSAVEAGNPMEAIDSLTAFVAPISYL